MRAHGWCSSQRSLLAVGSLRASHAHHYHQNEHTQGDRGPYLFRAPRRSNQRPAWDVFRVFGQRRRGFANFRRLVKNFFGTVLRPCINVRNISFCRNKRVVHKGSLHAVKLCTHVAENMAAFPAVLHCLLVTFGARQRRIFSLVFTFLTRGCEKVNAGPVKDKGKSARRGTVAGSRG